MTTTRPSFLHDVNPLTGNRIGIGEDIGNLRIASGQEGSGGIPDLRVVHGVTQIHNEVGAIERAVSLGAANPDHTVTGLDLAVVGVLIAQQQNSLARLTTLKPLMEPPTASRSRTAPL